MIEKEHPNISLHRQCELLTIHRSALCVNIDVVRNKEANDGLFTRREVEYTEESAAAGWPEYW